MTTGYRFSAHFQNIPIRTAVSFPLSSYSVNFIIRVMTPILTVPFKEHTGHKIIRKRNTPTKFDMANPTI